MSEPDPRYLHGHHESVLRSHRWRTARNSAAYLLGHLRPGLDLLDIGCGPGTLTADLATHVAPGRVLGIDTSPDIVAAASDEGFEGVEFAVDDVYELSVDEASFDVVHAHQVLQHVADPVGALAGMRRALRPGGLVAVRDSIYASKAWAPDDPGLVRWNQLYHLVARRVGGEPDAGRYLSSWAAAAGFEDLRFTSSTWTFADPETRKWWGGLWADRVRHSAYRDRVLEFELASVGELDDIAAAWQRWADAPHSTFIVVHGELIARRPLA